MRKQKSYPLFFSLLLFFKHSWCLDPSYESCVPKDCGDGRNITYPFYINGLQDPSCSYPGFKLTCNNNGSSILHISGNDLVVKHIGYENRSLRLAINQSCGSKIRNMTLYSNRFSIDMTTHHHLVWISNCSGNLSADLDKYRVGSCERSRSKEFVMVENDANLKRVKEAGGCDEVVVTTPVELADGEVVVDGSNYKEVVERGFVMQWRAADCGTCADTGGRCGFDMEDFQFRCFCPDRPHKVRCQPGRAAFCGPFWSNINILTCCLLLLDVKRSKKLRPKLIIIAVVVVGSAVILTVVATAIFLIRRAYKHKYYSSSKHKQDDHKYSRDLLDQEDVSVYFGVSVFSYAELQDATNHFDSSKELGDGGFGTVYYGKLRDGREVAVKRLYEHNYKRVQQFMNEVEILTRLRHQNLVSLYGCTSRRSRELLLVYEYISNGTVADHLHGDHAMLSPLTWQTRMKIAIETASALVYLHASEIIHRDVKTNNILLDNNFCVKVADFGLSRLLPNDVTHVSTAPQGTPGYVDPEYHQCYQLTDKSDVYSFGVVLIELISSMPAIDISRSRDEISLANMAINRIQRCALDELIDPLLGSDMDTERMTTSVAELAFRCLQFDSETRPTMNEALEVLKGIQTSVFDDNDTTHVEMKVVNKSELPLPPPTPENEGVGLLKKQIMASPISVTAKWHSTSSGSTTPNTSVCN